MVDRLNHVRQVSASGRTGRLPEPDAPVVEQGRFRPEKPTITRDAFLAATNETGRSRLELEQAFAHHDVDQDDRLDDRELGTLAGALALGSDLGDRIGLRDPYGQQKAAVEKALAGEEVQFVNAHGQVDTVTIEATACAPDGADVYHVTVNGQPIDVHVPPGVDPKEALARVLEFVTQQPPHLRQALKVVNLEPGPNPQDPYWEEQYGDGEPPPFVSAATAGGGVINIWNCEGGLGNLNPDTFAHEMGHLIGQHVEQAQDGLIENLIEAANGEGGGSYPDGWGDAVEADGTSVSGYGDNSLGEDFAEAWEAYLDARREGPEALAAFREKFPHRVEILDAVYNATYA